MEPPACDPGDSLYGTACRVHVVHARESEECGYPKRFQHVSRFAFFEVGFLGWIVRVGFALDLDMPLDGSALGVVQPDFIGLSIVIAGFTEEGPVPMPALGKVFRFEPARAFVRVPSSCPLPQT